MELIADRGIDQTISRIYGKQLLYLLLQTEEDGAMKF